VFNARFDPNATEMLRHREMTRWANNAILRGSRQSHHARWHLGAREVKLLRVIRQTSIFVWDAT
jgi:hypothetical protein